MHPENHDLIDLNSADTRIRKQKLIQTDAAAYTTAMQIALLIIDIVIIFLFLRNHTRFDTYRIDEHRLRLCVDSKESSLARIHRMM